MKKNLIILVFLLTFILLLNSVSAQFGVYSETNDLQLCKCSELTDGIVIKNTQAKAVTFKVSTDMKFATAFPVEFKLQPGKTQDVTIFIDAPCETIDDNLNIRITNDFGDDETLVKSLFAGTCQNLETKLYVDTSEINPCQEVNYKLKITNTGDFSENYLISTNYNEFINLSSEYVAIEPDNMATIEGLFKPSCDMYGETPVEFFVTAENNQLTANLKHDLMINQYYAYTLNIEEQIDLCEEVPETTIFTVESDVETPNEYFLELEGAPSFVKLNTHNFSLEGDEAIILNMTFDIAEGVDLGNYNFTLKSRTGYGDIFENKNLTLNVFDCYNIEVEMLEKDIDFCFEEERQTYFRVKNAGQFPETILFSIIPEWAVPWRNSFFLQPGDEANNTITFEPADLDGKYALVVEATLDNNISFSDKAVVEVVSTDACHFVDVSKVKYSIRRDQNKNPVIKLENKGRVEGIYKLNFKGEEWLKLEETEVTLSPGEYKYITLISSHTTDIPFGEYPGTLIITTDNVAYSKDLIIKLKDKPLCVKAFNYFAKRPCQAVTVFLIFAIVVLFFFALFMNRRPRVLKKKPFIALILILILLLVGFGLLIYFVKGPPMVQDPIDNSKASSTYHIWPQDSQYAIDMESFVSDPDSEDNLQLKFLHENENIVLSVEDGNIIFTPVEGWFGVEEVVIIAVDSQGAFARGPEMTLEVVEVKEYSLFQKFVKLCWYVNWFLLLVAFFFLSIIGWKKIRNKPKPRSVKAEKKSKKRR
ncbi:MAG: hypothetical protein ABH828_05485 [archaeon]